MVSLVAPINVEILFKWEPFEKIGTVSGKTDSKYTQTFSSKTIYLTQISLCIIMGITTPAIKAEIIKIQSRLENLSKVCTT